MADGAAVLGASGVTIRVHEVGGSERAGLLRALAGSARDPFDVVRDGRAVFRTFVIEIDNRSGVEVRFNPSFSTLHVGRGTRRFPLGYTGLYSFLRGALSDEHAVSKLAALIDETYFTVANGSRATKLLVFNKIDEKTRKLVLELPGFAIGDTESGARFEFAR